MLSIVKKFKTIFCLKSSLIILLCIAIVVVMLPVVPFNINANAANSSSQTQYSNISDFQKARWTKIQNAVFGQSFTSVQEPSVLKTKSVASNNAYFNWTDSGVAESKKFTGSLSATDITALENSAYTENYHYEDTFTDASNNNTATKVQKDVEYRVYDVSTADQLYYLMTTYINNSTYNIKFNIVTDLDFNGQNMKSWKPVNGSKSLSTLYYVEGNGHIFYNFRCATVGSHNTGMFDNLYRPIIMKNIEFKSAMLLGGNTGNGTQTGLIFGDNGESGTSDKARGFPKYLYNVAVDKAFIHAPNRCGAIAGGVYSESEFFENVSTKNVYIYGTDHVGGLNATARLMQQDVTRGFVKVSMNADMPKVPEAYVASYIAMDSSSWSSSFVSQLRNTNSCAFPEMYKSCYSIDCEIFSTGVDSGALISCGTGMIVRNCYTNNTIYANNATGGFIGRTIDTSVSSGVFYDDAGNRTIGSYFENCYSSGVVEGSLAMGGFVGRILGTRGWNTPQTPSTVTSSHHGVQEAAVFRNCYSTAMVGMDYAGRYVGGFTGLDNNYNLSATVNIDGKDVTAAGTFYIDCYAAGEVGNILTVTDKKTAATQEIDYFKNYEGDRALTTILPYYPTGGFVGTLGIDAHEGSNYNYTGYGNYGYFHNCYYDMQTTAMREIGVGLRDATSAREKSSSQFSVTGLTGIYTEKSDLKQVAGLTDFPVTYGSTTYEMDSKSVDSTVWNYDNGYYPQLKVFMVSDIDSSGNLNSNAENSVFYIKSISHTDTQNIVQKADETTGSTVSYYTGNESYPIGSNDNGTINADLALKTNKNNLKTAFRYSQASTSTVMLDHWDLVMDTSGAIVSDNDWVLGLDDNELKKRTVDSDNGQITEYYKDFENLSAGEYEFKLQSGNSWAYNYGVNGFNDDGHIVLKVDDDNSDVTIRFHYASLRSNNFYVIADITPQGGTTVHKTLAEGTDEKITPWIVVGSLNGWNASDNNTQMSYKGNGIYSYITELDPADYQFKITEKGGWTNNFGIGGVADGNNMSFTVKNKCAVTFTFNENTHITTVSADNLDNLSDIVTTDQKIEFEGYSVIGPTAITGFNWLESGKEIEAAQAGKLTDSDGDGDYTVSFTVDGGTNLENFNKNYGYKIIESAVDNGSNHYFYLQSGDIGINKIDLTFHFNPSTGDSYVTSNPEDLISSAKITSYSVAGAEGLTGYNWLGGSAPEGSDEQKEASEAGKMKFEPSVGANGMYVKTYGTESEKIKKGTYDFKIVGDGVWSSGVAYGDSSGSNYKFTLDEDGIVTIYFDPISEKIILKTTPESALHVTKYVVTGTQNLMGTSWDKDSAVMTYINDDALYEYTIDNVKSGDNYAFKVIEKGTDTGNNIVFYLDGDKNEYTIKVTYDAVTQTTKYYVYDIDTKEDVTASCVKDVKIDFFSVLGDQGLTGYNWGTGSDDEKKAAAQAGKMQEISDGVYQITYKNIPVGKYPDYKNYAFKVAANGTWDTGISYGEADGSNKTISLQSTENIAMCNITITFRYNKNTGQGTVDFEVDPKDVNASGNIDDSSFLWYICGDYNLVSNNAYDAKVEVYDTVRDITSKFNFTSGEDSTQRGLLWKPNDEFNSSSEFSSTFGDGFSVDYNVDGKSTTGTFKGKVLTLETKVQDNLVDGSTNPYIAKYSVSDFMPGKQWISVSSIGLGYSQDYISWEQAYQKYQVYMKNVAAYESLRNLYVQSILVGVLYNNLYITNSNVIEYLKYLQTNDNTTYEILKKDYGDLLGLYNATTGDNVVDPVPAAPTVNDQNIMGSRRLRLIPTTYVESGNDAVVNVLNSKTSSNQIKNLVKYNKNKSSDVSFPGISDRSYSYYNYAFTSAYAITDKIGLGIFSNYSSQQIVNYADDKLRDDNDTSKRTGDTYFAMSSALAKNSSYSDGGSRATDGLKADTMIDQSVIGSSYGSGKTIVKVYKHIKNSDGESLSKVLMNSNADTSSEKYIDYMKWTGQQDFTKDDVGTYTVSYYWALSDGRYLTDSKEVQINFIEAGLRKDVDIQYDSSGNNELTYTVVYTNDKSDDSFVYGLMDILPFNGDDRISKNDQESDYKTNKDVSYTVESVSVNQTGASLIRGVYYSTNADIRKYMYNASNQPDPHAADNLDITTDGKINDTSGYWTKIPTKSGDEYQNGLYELSNVNGVTAVSLTGLQLGIGESVELKFTVKYNAEVSGYYANNAYYKIQSSLDEETNDSNCCAPVSTTIVSRNLEGYAWIDKDIDGIVDNGELLIPGLKVGLYSFADDTKCLGTTVTDSSGKYSFENIPHGTYIIKFLDDEATEYTLSDGTTKVTMGKLRASHRLTESNVTGLLGSRNLLKASESKDESGHSVYQYYIDNRILPEDDQVYMGIFSAGTQTNYKYDSKKFIYTKTYQNAGFYIEDENTFPYSLNMTKYGYDQNGDGNKDVLEGVLFQLEYMYEYDEEDETGTLVKKTGWLPVHYDEYGFANMDHKKESEMDASEYQFATDSKGKLKFDHLCKGTYRLVEAKPLDDYNNLLAPVQFDLPYIRQNYNLPQGATLNSMNKPVTEGDTTYYLNVSYDIVNTKVRLLLPDTGNNGLFLPVIIGFIVFGLCIGILYLSKKLKRKTKDNLHS